MTSIVNICARRFQLPPRSLPQYDGVTAGALRSAVVRAPSSCRPAVSCLLASSPRPWTGSKKRLGVRRAETAALFEGFPTTRWQATGPTRPPRRRPVTALSRSQQVPDGWAQLCRARTMKCSRSHKCCDRRQMSWQRPAVYTQQHLLCKCARAHTHAHAQPRAQTSVYTRRRADIAVGQEVISYSAGPHSSCNQTCCVLCVAYFLQLQKRTKMTFLHCIWPLKGGKGSILLCTYFCLFVFVTIDTNSFSFSRTLMISVKGSISFFSEKYLFFPVYMLMQMQGHISVQQH